MVNRFFGMTEILFLNWGKKNLKKKWNSVWNEWNNFLKWVNFYLNWVKSMFSNQQYFFQNKCNMFFLLCFNVWISFFRNEWNLISICETEIYKIFFLNMYLTYSSINFNFITLELFTCRTFNCDFFYFFCETLKFRRVKIIHYWSCFKGLIVGIWNI